MTEDEVWPVIDAFSPVAVLWSRRSPEDRGRTWISWSIERADGDAKTVRYDAEDSCQARTGLAIPVIVSADIADGGAVQRWETDVEAFGPEPADIGFYDNGVLSDDHHVDLDDTWAAACVEHDVKAWGGPLNEAWLLYYGSFARFAIAIEGGASSPKSVAWGTCWQGSLAQGSDLVPGLSPADDTAAEQEPL